jgi:hypothetical protein
MEIWLGIIVLIIIYVNAKDRRRIESGCDHDFTRMWKSERNEVNPLTGRERNLYICKKCGAQRDF